MSLKRTFGYALLTTSLTACSIFNTFGTDNAPQPSPVPAVSPAFKANVSWVNQVDKGSDKTYLRLQPVIVNDSIISVDTKGHVTATSVDGSIIYQRSLAKSGLVSGVGTNGVLMAVVSAQAQLFLLDVKTGKTVWQTPAANIALAPPLVTDSAVYVKSIDGTVNAYNTSTGQLLWTYNHGSPALVLRASSPLVMVGRTLYSGFSDGQVVALSADNGNVVWEQTVANPNGAAEVQRMVDIDAKLIVADGIIYAASYQGQIVALRMNTGDILWQKPLSSYVDLAYVDHFIIAPEADGTITAFDSRNGQTLWQQKALAWHDLSGAIVVQQHLVIGDAQGYVHVFEATTGQYQGHVQPTLSAIVSSPLAISDTVYSQDSSGKLAAVHLG